MRWPILLDPKYVDDLSIRELDFLESLALRIRTYPTPTMSPAQKVFFDAIFQRVLGTGSDADDDDG